jgi:hypothetical protein
MTSQLGRLGSRRKSTFFPGLCVLDGGCRSELILTAHSTERRDLRRSDSAKKVLTTMTSQAGFGVRRRASGGPPRGVLPYLSIPPDDDRE